METPHPPARSDLLAPFRAEPGRSAILSDVDGTLAPIAPRADEARVPAEATAALRALSERYAVVACVTGRQALHAREMVGVDEVLYIGNHGMEILRPGAEEPDLMADASVREAARGFVATLDPGELAEAGLRVEDKGPIQVLHWRGCADDESAETLAAEIAARAEPAGLVPQWGRKVMEIRPDVELDKGTAVRDLIAERAPLAAALFAGDDRTDLDAFRALTDAEAEGRVGKALRIGVRSAEGPSEIADEADLIVDGTPGVLAILAELAA